MMSCPFAHRSTLSWVMFLLLLCLSQSAYAVSLRPQSDFLVHRDLGDIIPAYNEFDGTMYAGMIPIHTTDDASRQGELMFWLFAPSHPMVQDSLVMWLNGGPGCSSLQCGNLFETGPVTVQLHPAGWCCGKEDEPLLVNEHAWTTRTYMLYVEQPVGVGFSWGPLPETEEDVAEDMLGWLHNFFHIFEELKPYDFYMFGESYAGMYVPPIARVIHQDTSGDPINLKGIGLGNGWIDVQTQGPAVIDYAWWHGMIDLSQRDAFLEEWETCLTSSPLSEKDVDSITISAPYHVFTTPDECGIQEAIIQAAGQNIWKGRFEPNAYDVTTWDTYPVIQGSNASTFQQVFNHPDIKKALHAPNTFWEGCMPGAGRRRRLQHLGRRRRRLQQDRIPPPGTNILDQDRPFSMLGYLAELLDETDVRVLAYSADLDLSVCAQGTENALNTMEWSGAQAWKRQERGVWTTPTQVDKVAGYAKEVDGLIFLVVRNSGHMVPYNQPENGLDLLTRFLLNESYIDKVVPFFPADHLPRSSPGQPVKEGVVDDNESRSLIRDMFIYVMLLAVGYAMGYAATKQSRREGYHSVNGGH